MSVGDTRGIGSLAAQARPQLVAQVVPSPFTLGVDATVKRLLREGFLGEVLAGELGGGPCDGVTWAQCPETVPLKTVPESPYLAFKNAGR